MYATHPHIWIIVWSPYLNFDNGKWDICRIETAQLRFIKQILGVHTSATNNLVRGESEQFPLKSFIDFKSVEFCKNLSKSENPILKFCLETDKQLNTCNVPNTITGYIKSLSQNIADSGKSILTYSKNQVKKLIKKHYKEIWKRKHRVTTVQRQTLMKSVIKNSNLKNILKQSKTDD